jgi:transcriptional regulator with XRE-family HTH domain
MSKHMKTKFEEFISDPKQRRVFEREALSLEATELIAALMEQGGVNRTELAKKLESSKAHVSQVLTGSRNMTLHTLADYLFALGHRAQIDAFPLEPRLTMQRASYQIKGRPWTLLCPNKIGRPEEAARHAEAAYPDQPEQVVA